MILSLYPSYAGVYSPPGLHRPGHSLHTYLQMCGGLKITKVSFGRTSSAGLLFFLVPRGHELFRSLQHPLVPRRPIVHLRRKGPYGSVNSKCEPVVLRRAVCGSERLVVVLKRASLAWIFPPDYSCYMCDYTYTGTVYI